MKDSDSRIRILNASENLFAMKGYDATRVDEIAKTAGVNKALIYYYFPSKEAILETLLESLVNDVTKKLSFNFVPHLREYELNNNSEGLDDFLLNIMDYLLSKRNLIKVMIVESLKSGSSKSILNYFSQMLMDNDINETANVMKENGLNAEIDKAEYLVGDFFTGIMPFLNFVIYYDEWLAYYNMDKEIYKQSFINAFKQTHFNYHFHK